MNKAAESFPEVVERMIAAHQPRSAAEIRAWEWQNTIREHLNAAGLPQRFQLLDLKLNVEQGRVMKECKRLCTGTGAIIALVGERGIGKTSIAARMIIERAWDETRLPWHRRPPYRKMTDIIAKFKSIYADFGSIDAERLRSMRDDLCRDHPLLIIDELHECDDQKLKDRILTDIIDRRYSHMTDTILISNQTPEEFQRTTNDSVLSRLSEHGKIIECKWASFRARK